VDDARAGFLLSRSSIVVSATASARGAVRGPHRFTQKRPRTFVPALQRVAAVETSKNQLSRDFWCRSIFDFLQQYRSKGDIPAAFGQVRSIPETGRRMFYEYTH
jgi:hypothetical protein